MKAAYNFLLVVVITPLVVLFVCLGYQSIVTACQPDCAGANLKGVILYRPFTRSNGFFEVVLQGVDFQKADLRNANLQSVYLAKSDFRSANLQSANLIDADLAWACMRSTQLQNANLQYANIYDVNLRHADLSGANLSHAFIAGSDLSYANLTNAIMTDLQYDRGTRWPAGFDPKAAGAIESILGDSKTSRGICARHR